MADKKTNSWANIQDAWNTADWDSDPYVTRLKQEKEAARMQEEERRRQEDEARLNQRGSPTTRGRYAAADTPDPNAIINPLQFAADAGSSLVAGVKGTAAGAINELSNSSNPFARTLGDAAGLAGDLVGGDFQGLAQGTDTLGTGVAGKQTARSLATEANAVKQRIEKADYDWLDRASLDALSSPSSFASVFGGPAALIGGGDVYAQETLQAEMSGLSRKAAQERGMIQGGIETGMSVLPTGKLLTKIPFVKKGLEDVIQSNVSKWVRRSANQMGGEGLQEIATGAAQMGADSAVAQLSDDAELRDYANKQVPNNAVDIFNSLLRQGLAGLVGGGWAGSIETNASIVADAGKLTSDMNLANLKAKSQQLADGGKPEVDVIKAANDFLSSPLAERGDNLRPINVPTAKQLAADAERTAASLGPRSDVMTDAQDFATTAVPGAPATTPAPTPAPFNADAELARNEKLAADVQVRQTSVADAKTLLSAQQRADAKKVVDAEKTRVRTYNATRQSARSKIVEDSRALPAEQRVSFVADQLSAWDANNPKNTFAVPAAATSKKPVKKASVTPVVANTPSVTQTSQASPVETAPRFKSTKTERQAYKESFPELANATDEELDAAVQKDRSKAPDVDNLQMKGEEDSGVTPDQVVEEVRKRLGSTKANTIAKLIGDGKVELYQSNDQSSKLDKESAGYYTPGTGKVKINTSALDKNNIVGSILNQVAGHEFDHAARFSQNADISRSLGGLIDDKSTRALVSQIENATRNGNAKQKAYAKRVVTLAREGSTPATYEKEVAGYAVSEAIKQRDVAPSVLRTGVSAIRTWAKKNIPGIENDVNLDDIAYLSDKTVQAAARTDKSLAAKGGEDTNPLQMIYNKNSKGFKDATEKGYVYDSVDGNKKYVLSDADATINESTADKLGSGWNSRVTLGELLNHDVLYKEEPAAKDIPIYTINSLPGGAFAQYDPTDKAIWVTKHLIKNRNDPYANTTLREGLMHEVQHYVQDQGGQSEQFFDIEGNPQLAATVESFKQVKQENDRAAARVRGKFRDFAELARKQGYKGLSENLIDLGTAPAEMLSPFAKASAIADQLADSDVALTPELKALIDNLAVTTDVYREAAAKYNEAHELNHRDYLANITEREAFRTQRDVDVPESEIRARGNPEPAMREQETDPESGFNRTGSRIDVPQGDGTVKASGALPMSLDSITESLSNPDINTTAGKAMQVAKANLLYTSGIGKELFDKLQFSVGQTAQKAQEGLNAGAKIDAGIEALAKRQGRSVEEVRQEVSKRMDTLAALPTPEARERALAAIVRTNPELTSLASAYSDISNMTTDLVKQLMAITPNPTKADKEFWNGLLANSYGYTTRMYAAYQGEAGSAYSKKLKADADKGNKKLAKGKKLSRDQQIAVDKWNNAVKKLIAADLTIPSAEEIGKSRLDKIKYLYSQWIADGDRAYTVAKDAAREAGASVHDSEIIAREKLEEGLLEFAPNVKSEEMSKKAYDAVTAMLSLSKNEGALPKYLRTASADRGILQKRNELPDEFRSLLGEITDPNTRVAATISKQGELVARNKFLLHVRDNWEGKYVVNPQTASGGKFTETLTGDGFGPLNGWKTTPQIAAVIGDNLAMFSSVSDALAQGFSGADSQGMSILKAVDLGVKRAAGAAKVASVIFEGFGTIMNALGAPAYLASNGVINPASWASGVSGSFDLIKNELFNNNIELKDNTKRAIRLGVVDSAKVNELRDSVQRKVRERIIGTGPISKVGKGVNWTKRSAIELFAQADVWPKIAALNDRIKMLEAYYKAEGIKKTEEEIEQEAAVVIKDSNISSDRVPNAIKLVEARGITTFMPYFYSVPRALTMSFAHGAKDFADAFSANTYEARLIKGSAGLKRMTGTAGATAGLILATRALAAAVNGDDDDKVNEAKKVMRPEARYGDPILLGTDSTGAPIYFRLSRIDPNGPVNDMARMLMDPTTTKEEALGKAWQYTKDIAFANRFTKIITESLNATVGDGKTKDRVVRLERIAPESVSWVKEAARKLGVPSGAVETLTSAVDTLLPGMADTVDPNNKGVVDAKDWSTQAVSDSTRALGGRLDRADPSGRAYDLATQIKDARDEARKYAAEYSKLGKVDSAFNEARKADQRIYQSFRELRDLYEGMTNGLDMSRGEAIGVLKDSGISAVDIGYIVRGKLEVPDSTKVGEYSGTFSKSSLDMRAKSPDKMLTRDERAQAAKDRNKFLQEVRREGGSTRD